MKKDWFAHKANDYDQKKDRVKNVNTIAQGILTELSFSKKMEIMDFGSGTGLLLSEIAPYVGKITAIDISPSMNEELRAKKIACEIEILEIDLTTQKVDKKFDAIISSMTLHHVEEVGALFRKFYALLKDKGSIAIGDLDTEDGSFHSSDTGVFHYGFDRKEFKRLAENAGFRNVKIQSVSTIEKSRGTYSVFLLTGEK